MGGRQHVVYIRLVSDTGPMTSATTEQLGAALALRGGGGGGCGRAVAPAGVVARDVLEVDVVVQGLQVVVQWTRRAPVLALTRERWVWGWMVRRAKENPDLPVRIVQDETVRNCQCRAMKLSKSNSNP